LPCGFAALQITLQDASVCPIITAISGLGRYTIRTVDFYVDMTHAGKKIDSG
jgi:hypothetical protein